ncbi:translation initiation factor SUI1 [Nitzschia inconspicua]|uniref:Translation initiation factor SUI1 n=1 Tax=Nitzschia inconspicua TaxID=303405 RepID=A0A9K3M0Y0_9STRA|nr:translation initiation factor SUI1 [Nitzschia inconspicua]
MFHKEGSVSSSSGSSSCSQKSTKAVDVPLRKSHRRQLRDRAVAYFLRNHHHHHHHEAERSSSQSNCNDLTTTTTTIRTVDETSTLQSSSPLTKTIHEACDEIFLKGNLAARTLPDPKDVQNKAKTMVLYLKTPSSEHHHHHDVVPPANNYINNNNHNDNDIVCYWPYTTSTQFVWMSLEEKKEIIQETPTVALWAVMYPLVEMKYHAVVVPSVVSKYLCRGADLMKAGIVQIPQQRNEETVVVPQQKQQQPKKINKKKQHDTPWEHAVAIVVRGNPQPFAVGMCHVTTQSSTSTRSTNTATATETTKSLFGPGTKGLGVEIWNCYGDDLWRSSNTKQQRSGTTTVNQQGGAAPYDNGQYGNVGFVDGTHVVPLIQHENGDDDDTDDDSHNTEYDEDGNANENVNSDEPVPPIEEHPVGDNNNDNGDTPIFGENDNTLSQPTQQDDSSISSSRNIVNNNNTPSIDDNSPDRILHLSFCQALVNLKNKDLPMSTGTFYAQHVLSNRPDGTVIDLKATSYKKFGNYLREMVSKGLVQVGPDNKTNKANTDPMALLLSYNKKHDEIQSFSKSTTTSQQQRNTNEGNKSTSKKLVLVSLKIVPNHWISLLRFNPDDVKANHATSEERKGTGMLTVTEVRTMLETYIHREGLVSSSNPGFVNLDGPLTDIIYGKKKKQSSDGVTTPFEETMSRKDLVKLYTNKHLPAYAMVEMPGNKIIKLSKGDPPKIQLEVSRRQSNKFVTRVRGLEEYGIDPPYFCKDVKQRLAVSASVDTDPTSSGHAALPKKGYVELVFGANIVEELEALLSGDESLSSHGGVKKSEYAVPKQVLDVVLKKGVPGRKKK